MGYGVLIAPPDLEPIWALLGHAAPLPDDESRRVLAYVQAYDGRGGGVETAFKDDKQGLGLAKRSKKRLAAHQMVTLLTTLAHNVIVWTCGWLTPAQPRLARYGIKRVVRDIFHISGRIICDRQGHIVQIILNQAAPLVRGVAVAFHALLAPAHIAITLGET